jgi:hypothetical protein
MKKLLLVTFIFPLCVSYAQKATVILKPDVWLKADHLEDNFSFWTDQSGNRNNATPTNSTSLKVNGKINFNDAVSFDGDSLKLNIPFNLSQ